MLYPTKTRSQYRLYTKISGHKTDAIDKVFILPLTAIFLVFPVSVMGKAKTSAILKTAVLWDVMPCGSCKNRRFGGTCLRSLRRLLVTANVSSSSILATLMMEALRSSETSVLTRITCRNLPEDGILHSHRRENLRSYTVAIFFSKETDHLVSCSLFARSPEDILE
jgi:hypothetical protein